MKYFYEKYLVLNNYPNNNNNERRIPNESEKFNLSYFTYKLKLFQLSTRRRVLDNGAYHLTPF